MNCRCGLGQTEDPFAGLNESSTAGVWDAGWTGFPSTDMSGGSNTGGGILNLLTAAIGGATQVAKMAFQPVAHIAGPYGTSTIPVGTTTASGLALTGGTALSSISPLLLIGGAVLLVMAMGRGK